MKFPSISGAIPLASTSAPTGSVTRPNAQGAIGGTKPSAQFDIPAAFSQGEGGSPVKNTMGSGLDLGSLVLVMGGNGSQSQTQGESGTQNSVGKMSWGSDRQMSILQNLLKLVDQVLGAQLSTHSPAVQPGAPASASSVDAGSAVPSVKSEQDNAMRPTEASGRPPGDTRSAEQIMDDNPILKNLGNQKDINRDTLYEVFGDWTSNNPDKESRADAAYNASKYLNYVDNLHASGGGSRGGAAGNGDFEGITKDGDARSGTPAGHLADSWRAYESKLDETGDKKQAVDAFYSALPEDGKLREPNNDRDRNYVFDDGTNKSEFKGIMSTVGNALWFIPGLSNVMTGMGDTKGGFGETLLGGLKGAVDTAVGAFEGIANAVTTGRINPVLALVGAYSGALGKTEAAPEPVKEVTKYI